MLLPSGKAWYSEPISGQVQRFLCLLRSNLAFIAGFHSNEDKIYLLKSRVSISHHTQSWQRSRGSKQQTLYWCYKFFTNVFVTKMVKRGFLENIFLYALFPTLVLNFWGNMCSRKVHLCKTRSEKTRSALISQF